MKTGGTTPLRDRLLAAVALLWLLLVAGGYYLGTLWNSLIR